MMFIPIATSNPEGDPSYQLPRKRGMPLLSTGTGIEEYMGLLIAIWRFPPRK